MEIVLVYLVGKGPFQNDLMFYRVNVNEGTNKLCHAQCLQDIPKLAETLHSHQKIIRNG